ncbi:nitrate/nitrite transport system ATP-binding protein [Meinhardsimonia xiamenensis]|jgi:nitrate/nitrite transport system ATP-binding protein|uniref:Nitrate/nitrite transport system ATP-binding protein n=1 Tax=Meinhardsimonia xiamenensis TaxID=990712 RepID=A0A1G9H866_9RHOB|nr:nitrate ABC transporter ATP-binding protein [Meinhardsimonia xiamenensis]PRX29402.1 nitrate/nitrite transport system ATP-binding protein [Meinhardsimonia xiamenensis]SDL09072.1 nitrate/nitrite transport system ATP-binding protein [Meinhardsimonia xiamenensis]
MLELHGIFHGHGSGPMRVEVLRDVNLKVEADEFLVILGFSGTGKTTLINLMAGLDRPSAGRVTFRGAEVTGPGPERAVVFQNYALMPWLSVAENIALAVKAVRPDLSRAERAARVERYVRLVGLTHAASRRPAELSGGMRQRVNLARALAMDPEMLLMDEPLSALDALTRARLADEIERIRAADAKTCVLVTNDVDEAILLADRIIVLRPDGTLSAPFAVDLPRPRDRTAMNTDPAFRDLRGRITGYLMECNPLSRGTDSGRRLPSVVPLHGRPAAADSTLPAAVTRAAASPNTDRYLEFSQVNKVYATPQGPLTVVENFDLRLRKGEFVSLIGHSGCGKSTVLTMAAGLNDISSGGIILDGREVAGPDPERAVVFQSPSLFPWLTARENVAVGVDRVYPGASRAERQEVVEYYLERVGLADAMDRPAAQMSNGMRQRVGIARAFALSPKLLLLDEPFGMLDSLTRWELQEVLMEVWESTGVTAICVTHDVDEAILLADRVVMMTNGPRATIGRILDIDLPRPRSRRTVMAQPGYYDLRQAVLDFLRDFEHGRQPQQTDRAGSAAMAAE